MRKRLKSWTIFMIKKKKETPNSTEVPNNQRAINNQETGNKKKQKIKDTRRKRARAEETLSVARPMILTMKTTLFQRERKRDPLRKYEKPKKAAKNVSQKKIRYSAKRNRNKNNGVIKEEGKAGPKPKQPNNSLNSRQPYSSQRKRNFLKKSLTANH